MTKTIKKKPHTGAYKFRVAMAAIKGEKTVSQLCQEFGVVASQIYKWKTTLLAKGASIFDQSVSNVHLPENELDKLHATIGRLKVENDFLGRALGRSR
jgi:transposase-like protein